MLLAVTMNTAKQSNILHVLDGHMSVCGVLPGGVGTLGSSAAELLGSLLSGGDGSSAAVAAAAASSCCASCSTASCCRSCGRSSANMGLHARIPTWGMGGACSRRPAGERAPRPPAHLAVGSSSQQRSMSCQSASGQCCTRGSCTPRCITCGQL
jgi:hypothetical protein